MRKKRILQLLFFIDNKLVVGITADSTIYKADSTLITADNG